MPYLKIQTNQPLDEPAAALLLKDVSRLLAERLGKPEQYVMVQVEPGIPMLFGGREGPAAFLELKSMGLKEDKCGELTKALCGFLEERIKTPGDRVFIEFTDLKGAMFGWNSKTF